MEIVPIGIILEDQPELHEVKMVSLHQNKRILSIEIMKILFC